MTTMHFEIPKEARPVARVLLLGPGERLLLLLAQDAPDGPRSGGSVRPVGSIGAGRGLAVR
jgi:hypothetical protein